MQLSTDAAQNPLNTGRNRCCSAFKSFNKKFVFLGFLTVLVTAEG